MRKLRNLIPAVVVAVTAMFVIHPVALAQPAPGDRTSSVLMVSVTPGMMDEWAALVKNEVLPALKKAGVKSGQVYQTMLGNTSEFQIVTPLDKMSNLDLPPV